MDGDSVVSTFYEPMDYAHCAVVRVAVGDYDELVDDIGRDNALASILSVVAHEMTHYFQWINQLKLTDKGLECQAN